MTTLTRANMEAVLIRRCGKLLTAAGLDGVTSFGANHDLTDPLATALRAVGVVLAVPTEVADDDVALLDLERLDEAQDRAELRALESALGNLDLVDVSYVGHKESLDQLGKRLEGLITKKRAALSTAYGSAGGSLSAGAIGLGFAETWS
jgi:hypothetical protein